MARTIYEELDVVRKYIAAYQDWTDSAGVKPWVKRELKEDCDTAMKAVVRDMVYEYACTKLDKLEAEIREKYK